MTTLGYFLSGEEFGPRELVSQAVRAERAGFSAAWISDHFHPWNDEQGNSSFVWTVIGAIAAATERLEVTTGVSCPTVRIHPAVLAQATATTAALMPGRFGFGVGTGEALNEHILGDHWPPAPTRLEMLEEAIEVIRALWTGEQVTHYGEHYTVENARIYTLPEELPPILISGFGPKATRLAGRIGDGYCSTMPDRELVELFDSAGGAGKPKHAGMKVCYGPDEAACRRTAHRLWRNEGVPGQLLQDLPTPAHFEQAAELVTEDMIAESIPCGPDLDAHLEAIQSFVDAGFTHVFVQQIGPEQEGFFSAYEKEILPRFA